MYIPGRLIVIHEKNEIYFIEFNFDELKDNFPDVFSENFIICLKNSSDN